MVVTDQELIEALISTGGIYAHAAKKLKITRQSVHFRVHDNPEIKQIVDSLAEVNLDEAESELHQRQVLGAHVRDELRARHRLERRVGGHHQERVTEHHQRGADLAVAQLDDRGEQLLDEGSHGR